MKIIRLTEDQKVAASRLGGLLAGAFTLFALLSIVSYMIHWTQDMSIAQQVVNDAGSLGAKFGRLLVCEGFGIGSLFLPVLALALTLRLMFNVWRWSMVKTTVLALVWMFVSALALSYVNSLFGPEVVFGGGLGGYCGSFVSKWLCSVVGVPVAGALIMVVVATALAFSSSRFVSWLVNPRRAGERRAARLAAREERRKRRAKKNVEEEPEEEPRDPFDISQVLLDDTSAEPLPEPGAEPGDKPEGRDPDLEIIEDNGMSTTVKEELPRIDNRLDPPEGLPKYKFPTLDLLSSYSEGRHIVPEDEIERNTNRIRTALTNYKIGVNKVQAIVGPTVTLYKVYPETGVRSAEIRRLAEDIAMNLNSKGVRIINLSDSVGIEVPNDRQSTVPLKAMLNDPAFRESDAELPVAIGYTITQQVRVFDLADAPHLLIAGATKQGKSVGLNVIVSSLLYSKHPSELKFVFIDPKMVEFSSYSSLLKHYLAVLPDAADEDDEKNRAIVKTAKDADKILRSLCVEMDDRYKLLSTAGVNKLTLYNEKYLNRKLNPEHGHRFMPYIVVVVDEYADLTMTSGVSPEAKACGRSISNSIIRLAQKGRAAGLHVILATQRPSVDVINGLIKANFPMRIAFRTSQRVDSTTILDSPGAEKLIGKGDMLICGGSVGIEAERLQCAFISGEEVDKLNLFIGSQTKYGQCYNTPYYLPTVEEEGGGGAQGGVQPSELDSRFADAARMVVMTQRGSTSDIQRRLGMGYAKAGRVMDQLEAAGIVGPQEGSKPREVLIHDPEALEELLSTLMK